MRFKELQINELEGFASRGTLGTGSSVGYSHGRDLARSGGSQWQQAQRDADTEARRKAQQARAGTLPASSSTNGSNATTDPDAPNNPGSAGDVRFAPNALTTLNGQQSSMVGAAAGAQIEDTITRARRMAGFFGSTITVNDAIARSGTSRETQTQGSQHFHGRALDVSTAGMSNEQKLRLVQAAQRAGFTGFGFGANILHVDTGPRRHWAYGNSTYGGQRVADLGRSVRAGQLVGTTATA